MSTPRHAISVGHAAPTLSCSHIPCHGMVHCVTAPVEGAPTKRAGRQKRSRSWEPECQSHMPTSARHDDEQTGERLAALTRQGRDAMPEQGCDGEPFANTPPNKKTQASPKSTRKELAAQERRRLEKKASRTSRGDCTIAHLDIQHIDRKAASTQDIVTTWLQSNPKKTTEVNHGSATRDIKKVSPFGRH